MGLMCTFNSGYCAVYYTETRKIGSDRLSRCFEKNFTGCPEQPYLSNETYLCKHFWNVSPYCFPSLFDKFAWKWFDQEKLMNKTIRYDMKVSGCAGKSKTNIKSFY